jgi:hypothetical protein
MPQECQGRLGKCTFIRTDGKTYGAEATNDLGHERVVLFLRFRVDQYVIDVVHHVGQVANDICHDTVEHLGCRGHAKG